MVADNQGAPICGCIFKHATHNRDVDLTTVRSVAFPGSTSQSSDVVDAVGHRLADISHMTSDGMLQACITPYTHDNREGIAEHSFSIMVMFGCLAASA